MNTINLEQLKEIKEVYDMLNNGMSNPIKINSVYKYINTVDSIEVPIRAKITAINRFMMLNYDGIYNTLMMKNKVDDDSMSTMGSIGTMDNLDKQSHSENTDNNSNQSTTNDLLEVDFLTADDKKELKTGKGNLVIEKDKGRKNSNSK